MEKRLNMQTTEPLAFKAMLGLETYLTGSGLDRSLKELIKIRASQINNCAYCINMHTTDAVKNGETHQRLFLLSAWREAPQLYTEAEQIVLEMTEEITLLHQQGLSSDTYAKAKAIYSDKEIAQIIMAIVTINAWNRIAVSTHQEIEH